LRGRQTIPLDGLVALLERQLNAKCRTYKISFGIFKSGGKHGAIDYSSLVVITDNFGNNYNLTVPAKNMHDMFTKVNDELAKVIKK
jgi:hypothetical protein